ncbi:MAG: ATP-NAD kinase [Chloroflexi bacterium]|nr:MAG: ATP-NAD kinase [Chloroflexota bacterium]
MSSPLVGIIANPASGRDIRRLVAHGTVFDNNEKTAIVRRVLLGLEAVGIRRVAYMPEHDFGILPRAITGLHGHPLQLEASPLEMPVLGTSADSTRAAQLLAELGAGCIITLGGDGTNRVVAKGCGTVPLVPISTGTNNVFPTFLEGTVAGVAAGLVARDCAGKGALQRAPRLEILVNGTAIDSALVDVVVSEQPFVGSRAIWDLSLVREVVLSRIAPATIGLSALGGALLNSTVEVSERAGMHIVLGDGGREVMAALAPGIVKWVGVRETRKLQVDDVVHFRPGTGTVALDGEREIEIPMTSVVEVRLCADGPFVVDVPAALEGAAHAGHFRR